MKVDFTIDLLKIPGKIYISSPPVSCKIKSIKIAEKTIDYLLPTHADVMCTDMDTYSFSHCNLDITHIFIAKYAAIITITNEFDIDIICYKNLENLVIGPCFFCYAIDNSIPLDGIRSLGPPPPGISKRDALSWIRKNNGIIEFPMSSFQKPDHGLMK